MDYLYALFSSAPVISQTEPATAPPAKTAQAIASVAGAALAESDYLLVFASKKTQPDEADVLSVRTADAKEADSFICSSMDNAPASAKDEKEYQTLLQNCYSHSLRLNIACINNIFRKQIGDDALAEVIGFHEFIFDSQNLFEDDEYKKMAESKAKLGWLSQKLRPLCSSAENVDSLLQLALAPIDTVMREFLTHPSLKKTVLPGSERSVSIQKSKKGTFTIERTEIISVVDDISKIVLKTFKLVNKIKIPTQELSGRSCTAASTVFNSITHYLVE